MPSRITIVHNARAPRSPVHELEARLSALGKHVTVVTTRDAREGADAAHGATTRGCDALVAAGGDGTVRSVLEAAQQSHVPLAVLPLGTANDLATHLGVHSPHDVVDVLIGEERARVDLGLCAYQRVDGGRDRAAFVTTAGVGVLAAMARMELQGAAGLLKRTFKNAAWPLLFALGWRGVPARGAPADIEIDSRFAQRTIALFEISKVPTYGGFLLAPGAAIDDGLLHLWFFGRERLSTFASHVARTLLEPGSQLETGHVEYVSRDPSTNTFGWSGATRASIRPEVELPVHVHGDFVGLTPASFEIVPRGIELCVRRGWSSPVPRLTNDQCAA